MKEHGITTMTIKQINKKKVYQYIYHEKHTSKLQIVQDLHMGLSTVSQNLTDLEQEGLIERQGYFESTGGRKAQIIQIVSDYKISIGIGILKNMLHIVSINLFGEIIAMDTYPLVYSDTDQYYSQVADTLDNFIEKNNYLKNKILGVSIATQGIISPDGENVTYSAIMNNEKMSLSDFSTRIPYPCRLEHDSKSAAYLELWNHKDLESAIVFLLNRNMGGAIITNHSVHQGTFMHSGTIEHMCINSDGPLCYCGNRGCLETYCSANSLEEACDMTIKEFFPKLRAGDNNTLNQIWLDYLNHLAFAMKNLNMVIDSPIIISGYLAPYFTEGDIEYLLNLINTNNPFPLPQKSIMVGTHGQYTPAVGAALFYVNNFIQSIT